MRNSPSTCQVSCIENRSDSFEAQLTRVHERAINHQTERISHFNTNRAACCSALTSSRINANKSMQTITPADAEVLAAWTWTTEGVESPDRLPLQGERKCNGGVEWALADRELLLKRKTKQSYQYTKNRTNKKNKTKQPQTRIKGKQQTCVI